MTKYCAKKLKECEEWIAENGLMEHGGADLKDFVKAMGINDKTYRHWLAKPDFQEMIERAKEKYKKNLTKDLVLSLAKKAKGYEVEETKTTYIPDAQGKPHIRNMQTTKRHVPGDTAASIFLLTNLDPEHYQNKQRSDIAFKKDSEDDMSLDEVNEELERMRKADALEKEESEKKEADKD